MATSVSSSRKLQEELLAVERLGLGAAEELPAQALELALQVQQFALQRVALARDGEVSLGVFGEGRHPLYAVN